MADQTIRCVSCGKVVAANPRAKNQNFCKAEKCQKERKRQWLARKLEEDADYRQNRYESQRRWMDEHPGYWHQWRKKHRRYVNRNRLLQQGRDRRRRLYKGSACKDDTLQTPESIEKTGTLSSVLAKCDTLAEKVKQIQLFVGMPP